MNKEEFLQSLRRDLSGDVPQNVLEENVQYYREYIDGEVAKGRSEAEVIEELGTPRLIAKNIEDTTELDEEEADESRYTDRGYGDTYSGSGSGYDNRGYGETGSTQGRGSFHLFDLSKWYGKVLVFLIVFAVIYLVCMIVGGIFSLLAPFLGPILVIWLIVTIIRGSNRR